MRTILLLCLACLLSACANSNNYQQTLQSWQGGNTKTLVERWGRPDEKMTAPNGNTVMVYYINRTRTTTPPSSPVVGVHIDQSGRAVMTNSPNTNYTWNRGPASLACSTMFEANPNGKIINVQSKGPGCYATEGFAAQRKNPQ